MLEVKITMNPQGRIEVGINNPQVPPQMIIGLLETAKALILSPIVNPQNQPKVVPGSLEDLNRLQG